MLRRFLKELDGNRQLPSKRGNAPDETDMNFAIWINCLQGTCRIRRLWLDITP